MDLRQVPGVGFHPRDDELVEHYLYNRVQGLPLSCDAAVAMADVYSTEPWNLVPDGQDEAFFFSQRTLKNPKGKGGRAARTAGNGCWRLEKKKGEEVVSGTTGLVVGTKSFLTYAYQGLKNYGWTMYEYLLQSNNQEDQQLALCRIKKSSKSNHKKRKRQEDDDVETTSSPSSASSVGSDKNEIVVSCSSSQSSVTNDHPDELLAQHSIDQDTGSSSFEILSSASEFSCVIVPCNSNIEQDDVWAQLDDHDELLAQHSIDQDTGSCFENLISSSEFSCVIEPCNSNIEQDDIWAQLDDHETAGFRFENSLFSQSITPPLLCSAADDLQVHDHHGKPPSDGLSVALQTEDYSSANQDTLTEVPSSYSSPPTTTCNDYNNLQHQSSGDIHEIIGVLQRSYQECQHELENHYGDLIF